MCAEDSVQLEMHFRKRLGTGLFGGEGFLAEDHWAGQTLAAKPASLQPGW